MPSVAIVGTGFVADLYAASLKTFPAIRVVACWDINGARLARFCAHWGLPAAESFAGLLAAEPDLLLNLTNPHAHCAVSRQALEAGCNVYSEKPMATDFADAMMLHRFAQERGLQIASAPCSFLSTTAQTLRAAVEANQAGTPRLVYAELDDDFVSQAPVRKWLSESGAPWPVEDEFAVGCTLEHAGYYLSWLMAIFGPVRTVVAASAQLAEVSHLTTVPVAPDFSAATLFFHSGIVARLTCSILAPHDHQLRIVGDRGVLSVAECWDNRAPVKLRRRHVVRRRLVNSPIARKIAPPPANAHPAVKRRGAAAMNFALGPAEMLDAIACGRQARQAGDFALHLTEVSLAIQDAGEQGGAQTMRTSFVPTPPTRWDGTQIAG